ncbi:inositol monophosphatase family protein [Calycomorphotria hydatis]|uniref:Inositol monophosphatase family protein n=1 Tax=Calycomorphotria hydatis TaxID=2528027 RepID=A0A517TAQ0_9PLAN|nr:inositol monophosphatase family protein [Calycomorphotria hydatis]QDT65442.1 Inositol monophosphatase family protein [Calycomorphotria hydatis]
MPDQQQVIDVLSREMPSVLRWSGAIARELRKHNISVGGKTSGSSNTDALTLADLTIQELLVGALRDVDPILRECKIEAEEETGELDRFASEAELTIALDPIDGTKQFRDRTGDGYAVMMHCRTVERVVYSLVFIPATGPHGRWVEVLGDSVKVVDDDPSQPARAVLDAATPIDPAKRPSSKKMYMIGFIDDQPERVAAVTSAGLEGVDADDTPGSIYDLFGSGEFGGSLIHSPNIYDFPVSHQIAEIYGGNAVWVHNGEPVHYREMWMDERASMLRLPGIVACSHDKAMLDTLCEVAKDWPKERYRD